MFNSELWQKPTAAGAAGFYTHQIANSCRFNKSAGDFFTRTPGSASNRKTWTWSCWFKKSLLGNLGNDGVLFGADANDGGSNYFHIRLNQSNTPLDGFSVLGGCQINYSPLYRDTSAYYHFVVAVDTTQGVDANRVKFYLNGTQVTTTTYAAYPSLNFDSQVNNTTEHQIGELRYNGSTILNGYMAEMVLIDGLALGPDSFGETKNGVWIPKDPSGLTFGTNGTYLNFADSGDLGNDVSGNNNDWANTGIAAHDQMLDSPTFGSEGSANFPTFNPLTWNDTAELPPSEGNCMVKGADAIAKSGNPEQGQLCTMGVSSGKWYWEVKLSGGGATTSGRGWSIGIASVSDTNSPSLQSSGGPRAGNNTNGYAYTGYSATGIYHNASNTSYGSAPENNDVIGMLLDLSSSGSGILTIYKNNSSMGVAVNGSIAAGTWTAYVGLQGGLPSGYNATINFGQDSTFGGLETAGGNADANGYGDFLYAVPSGYLAMCAGNLPTAAEVDPAQTDDDYPQKLFQTILYTGNSGNDITVTTKLKTDWVWAKARAVSPNRNGYAGYNGGAAASMDITTTDSSIQIEGGDWCTDTYTYVAWLWRANGGTTSSNTEGSITSTVQVDPSGCFSIGTYTGNATNSTIGHGLSAKPSFIVVKSLSTLRNWIVWASGIGNDTNGYLQLNETGASGSDSLWNGIAPTADVFSVNYGTTEVNAPSGTTYVFYAFANTEGYIKSGSYEGNGDADGTFVYTGFRPAWIMTKSVDSTSAWHIFDNQREGYNVDNDPLEANDSTVEATTDMIDILSNGFKLRIATDPNVAETYMYLAIAHNPFQYATAR